ncbi:MAG: hypothetical protein BWY86_01418 [Candidatus Aminicenantes bacterium ADurb.Bin508]|nr:MAG: hypothetical protein BWY86_01418 [Candidatus Aminicenantes bacterium ADurb.Bin508]
MVVESEPPLSICRIQWLDMRECIPIHEKEALYASRYERLLAALEEENLLLLVEGATFGVGLYGEVGDPGGPELKDPRRDLDQLDDLRLFEEEFIGNPFRDHSRIMGENSEYFKNLCFSPDSL